MRRVQSWQLVVVAGTVLAGVRLAAPVVEQWSAIDPLVAGGAMVASFTGAARLPRNRRLPWLLFGIAQGVTAGYGLVAVAGFLGPEPGSFGPVFAVFYGIALAGLVAAWRRLGHMDPDVWLDAAILATAVGILAWEFVVVPAAGSTDLGLSALAAGITDLVVLLVVARLFVRPVGPPGYLVLLALVGLMVAAYASHYLQPASAPLFDRILEAIWVLGYTAWGALALHPATLELGEVKERPRDSPRGSAGFLAVLAMVLAAPGAAFARAIQDEQRATFGVLVAGTVALAALMFVRAARILRLLQRDVAERREAELTAVESRERLAMYQALVPVGVFATDGQGRILYRNERLEQLTGIARDADETRDLLAAIYEDDRERAAATRARAIREGAEWSTEVRLVLPDGTVRWVAVRAQPFRAVADRAEGWIGSVTDITPQVIARVAAEEREGFLRALIDQSPVGIQVYGADGVSLAYNPAMQRLFGAMDLSTGIGTFNVLTHPFSVANGIAERARPAFSGAQVELGPTPIRFDVPGAPWRVEQPDIHLYVLLFPVTGPGGEITRVIGFYEDATRDVAAAAAEQRLQEQLRETQKLEALGVLAGGIAHDFNNLLVAILGNVGIARSELPPGSPLRVDLEHAEAAAERAADLARQMLAYSGRGTFVTSTARLDQVVTEIVQLLERSIAKGARLELALDEAAWIEGDVTQVRQVLLNLIVNASDALDGIGTIRISTGEGTLAPDDPFTVPGSEVCDGPCAWVAVSDTGMGMDAATMARAFEPFFTTKSAGRGLGLATTLGIVRGQHGAIRLRSALGRGSTFEVFLPLASPPEAFAPVAAGAPGWGGEAAGRAANSGAITASAMAAGAVSASTPATTTAPTTATASAPAAPHRVDGTGRRVLVVDDEDGVRQLGRRVLERAGFRVTEAADGGHALATFESDPAVYDAVLLDITLPTMDGLAVLASMRSTRPALPVVLSSGWSGDEVMSSVLRHPCTSFLPKPYGPGDLLASIDGALQAGAAAGG